MWANCWYFKDETAPLQEQDWGTNSNVASPLSFGHLVYNSLWSIIHVHKGIGHALPSWVTLNNSTKLICPRLETQKVHSSFRTYYTDCPILLS